MHLHGDGHVDAVHQILRGDLQDEEIEIKYRPALSFCGVSCMLWRMYKNNKNNLYVLDIPIHLHIQTEAVKRRREEEDEIRVHPNKLNLLDITMHGDGHVDAVHQILHGNLRRERTVWTIT